MIDPELRREPEYEMRFLSDMSNFQFSGSISQTVIICSIFDFWNVIEETITRNRT